MDGIGSADAGADSREALLHTIAVLQARTQELETECARLRSTSVADLDTPAAHDGDGAVGEPDRDGETTLSHRDQERLEQRAERAEEGLRASEEKYRTLFETMDEGFHVIELIHDEQGKAVDYRFMEVNRVFERLSGLHDVVGKLGSEVTPNEEAQWLQAWDAVARTGEPIRIEDYNQDTDRWYVAYASRVGSGDASQVAVFFDDITESKRAEAGLRQSGERNAFLVRFTDAVRGFSDPALIEEAACRMLAEQLGTERTLWAVVDWATREYVADRVFMADGTAAEPTNWPFDPRQPFAADHLAGRSVVYDDIEGDPRIPDATKSAMAERGIRSGIAVPVVVGETLRTVLSTSQHAPRHWQPEEVAFVEALAGRAWAEIERARAEAGLRTNEERMRWQKEAFQAVVNRAPLADALNFIARMVTEDMRGEARTAFYLADEDGVYLHPVWGAGDCPNPTCRRSTGLSSGRTRSRAAWRSPPAALL